MGLFGFLKSTSEKFFEGLKDNMSGGAHSLSKELTSTLENDLDNYDGTKEEIDENIDEILNKLDIGLSYDDYILSFYKPSKFWDDEEDFKSKFYVADKIDDFVSRGKKFKKLYYEDYWKLKCYALEITFKEDKVYGWKDLRKSQTKIKIKK